MAEKRDDELDPIELAPTDEPGESGAKPKQPGSDEADASTQQADAAAEGDRTVDPEEVEIEAEPPADDDAEATYDLEAPPPVDDPGAMRSLLLEEMGDEDDEDEEARPKAEKQPGGESDEAGEVPGQPKYRSEAELSRIRAEKRAQRSREMKEEYERKQRIRLIVGGAAAAVVAVVVVYFAFIH